MKFSWIHLLLLMPGFLANGLSLVHAQYQWGPSHPALPECSWHFTEDGAISAIHGLIRPQAWHHGGKTYVVYQGRDNAPMITCYDHQKKQWRPIVQAGVNPLGTRDTHGAPALAIDQEGYIHLFFGSHGGKQIYRKSKRQGEITQWESMPPVAGAMTYPCPVFLQGGTLVLLGRAGGHASPWIEKTSNDGGKTWKGSKPMIDFRPEGAYGTPCRGAEDKTIHFTWCLQQKTHTEGRPIHKINHEKGNWWTGVWDERHHCFYMVRDESGQWRNARGEALKTPVTLKQAFEKCLVYRGDWPHHGQHGTVEVDAENRPCITWIDGILPKDKAKWNADSVSYHHKFARWDGREWMVSNITTTDSMWDMGQALFPRPDGTIDVYLIAGGSDTTLGRWGGDLQQWRSTDFGKTWKKQADVITFAQTGRLFNCPLRVVNAHPDAKLVFCTWTTDQGYRSDDFTHNVYLYGNSGFCTKRYQDPWKK